MDNFDPAGVNCSAGALHFGLSEQENLVLGHCSGIQPATRNRLESPLPSRMSSASLFRCEPLSGLLKPHQCRYRGLVSSGMGLGDITRSAVLAAIQEYKDLGQDAFLERYGFEKARAYLLLFDGERFDSKAIAGAAHGYLSGREPLKASDFSGGDSTVARKLRDLGFVVSPRRSPDWTRDEVILACDLVRQNSWRQLEDTDDRVHRVVRHPATAPDSPSRPANRYLPKPERCSTENRGHRLTASRLPWASDERRQDGSACSARLSGRTRSHALRRRASP